MLAMSEMMDEMIICDSNGMKSRVHKHYLTMFLREAYKMFEETFQKISFFKIFRMRPKGRKGQCSICENGKLIEFQINPGSIASRKEWIKDDS